MVFTFSIFDQKATFGQIYLKTKNYFFELYFGNWTNSNIQNSMVVFTFLVETGCTLFWQI